MKPFPSERKRRREIDPERAIFYVYEHIDPNTNELVYLGHGCKGRAWVCGIESTLSRCKDHAKWTDHLMVQGYLPEDWVRIYAKGMSKKAAAKIEHDRILDERPKFNKLTGESLLKFTPDIYRKSLQLREDGKSYKEIGEIVGLSTMVIHRGLNKRVPSLERMLEQEYK